ncbi:MAG: glycosyltransferase family 39 protein [Nevskia sp.]|nr:glycosyltransferase family 39 protein [Nevskia sp.]
MQDALRRSDTLDYLQYAFNLLLYHSFSHSHIADGPIMPDSFRDPGYPAFLAGLMLLLGFTDRWYAAVLAIQAILGGLSACLTVLIARRWLGPAWSLAAGLLAAIWPHTVAFSAFVLSETLFGFLLTLALWLSCRAFDSASRLRWFVAGLGFGLAAMVNAVVVPLAPLLALLSWRRGSLNRSLALALLLGAMLLPATWALRSWSIPAERSPQGRAEVNLVQGSWPEYHRAYIAALGHDPAALQTMQAIGREQDLMLYSPAAGLASMFGRFRAEPWRYLAWYASKPALLWAWHIRMGWGDIYAYPVDHPIYLTNPVMPAVEALCLALNPLLFVLMALLVLAALLRARLTEGRPALYVVVLTAGFATLVYSLLQAEPRYSVPLRPLEMLLAVTALEGILRQWRSRFRGDNDPAAAPPSAHPRTTAPGGAN